MALRFRGALRMNRVLAGAAVLLVATGVLAAQTAGFSSSVTPGLVQNYTRRFGSDVASRISAWRHGLQGQALRPTIQVGARPDNRERELLQKVNALINQAVRYKDDIVHWGVADYWATPAESVASAGGDCEDYAIAKYFALKELGVPVSRLRITYVRAVKLDQSHMVLAWYASDDDEPLILDNLDPVVRPASQRTDLIPVYSFNDEDLFLASAGGDRKTGSPSQVRLWRQLLEKLESELKM